MLSCRLRTMGLKIWPKNLMLASHRERQGKRVEEMGGRRDHESCRGFLLFSFSFYKLRCTHRWFCNLFFYAISSFILTMSSC